MSNWAAGIRAHLKKTGCAAFRWIYDRVICLVPTEHWRKEKPMAEERRSPNLGNFAEDRERASRAGRIGGQHSSGNFANDRERAAEAGRKGGRASRGQGSRSRGAQDNAQQLHAGS
jgi:general stress protein YciG